MSTTAGLDLKKNYPVPIRVWNFLGGMSRKQKLNKDDLLKKAVRNTGLSDFGDNFFIEPLEKLISSINGEADLHPFGFHVTKTRLVNLLSNRLRAEEFCKRYPEVLGVEIPPVWWIVGLQRTGTTFLHRLLASIPGSITIHSWEVLNPVPLENDPANKKRISLARTSERGLRYIAPDFFTIHPVEHLSPEEEVLLLDVSFMSTVPEATLNVPSYAAWLENQDQTEAYEYMRKLLKIVLLRRKDPSRLILKSPHHMEYLETLVEVFPNTQFIFTHRDPIETIASFCSMIYFSRKIFKTDPDKKEIAKHWVTKIKRMMRLYLDFRLRNPNFPHVDVSYRNLVEDPRAELRQIFEKMSGGFKEEFQEHVNLALKNNRKNKFGAHKYTLKDFDLETNTLEDTFREYKTKYSSFI